MNLFYIACIVLINFEYSLSSSPNKLNDLLFQLKKCLHSENFYGSRLISQKDSSYKRLNYQWQLRGGEKTPLAYFLPQSSTEISSAVKCSQKLGISSIPKSGGHSFEKFSYGTNETDLIIDLRLMNWIDIDSVNTRATVEAGTLLGPLISKLWQNGKFVIPTGSCPVVGISGLTLGGGFGFLSRLLGLTSDHVEEMEVITADGNILQANSKKNIDLFWALRGGGSSFGIVSKFVFKLSPAPPKMIFSIINFETFSFLEILTTYQKILLSNPPKSVFLQLLFFNSTKLSIAFSDASGDPTTIQSYIKMFPTPKSWTNKMSSYHEFAEAEGLLIGNYKRPFQLGKANEIEPIYQIIKSFFLYNVMEEEELKTLEWSWLNRVPRNVYVKFSQFMDSPVKDVDTAFVHRNPFLLVAIEYETDVINNSEIENAEIWMEEFFEGTKETLHHTESYQNYVQQDLPDFLDRYYGKNLQRLRQIKTKYDPNNFFRQSQSIPPL